jgi:YHS domain-containing protein
MRLSSCIVAVIMTAMVSAMVSTAIVCSHSDAIKTSENSGIDKAKSLVPQTTCPVMGEPIDTSMYVDYKDKRIYVCCSNCIEKVKNNPEKYIKKLERMGQSVETIGDGTRKESNDPKTDTVTKDANTGYWTCTMDPEIHQSQPGNCPKCGMKLVFKKNDKIE